MKNRELYLFQGLVFILVILSNINNLQVFATESSVAKVVDIVQLPMYLGLAYLIYNKNFQKKDWIISGCVGIILLIGYIVSGQAAFLKGLLLILAAKDFPLDMIFRVCRRATTSVFVLSVVLWILGISDSGIGRRGNVALGYVHPNVLAQVIMIIMFLWIVEKAEELTLKHYVWIEVVSILCFVITGCKTVLLVMLIAPGLIELVKRGLASRQKKIVHLLCEGSQCFIFAFTCIAAKLLPIFGGLKILDLILTNRLFLNYYLLKEHTITLFGQNINLQDYSGNVYNDIHDTWSTVITCDCTYVMSILLMGIIPTIVFLVVYVFLVRRAIRMNHYVLVTIAILLAVYSFMEAHMLEIYSNFVYLSLLAEYGTLSNQNKRGEDENDT